MLETLINLGVCYYKLGLLDESLPCFENALISLRNKKIKIKKSSEHQNATLNSSTINSKEY